jgi:hypothetical protein
MRVCILMAAVLALMTASCGDDGGGGFKPESPFRDLSSPENVLNNIAASFNERDYEKLLPIIHDEFRFYIWSRDIGVIPGYMAPDGYMSREVFLEAAHNMMVEGYIPCGPEPAPELGIEEMDMILTLAGDLTDSDLVDCPTGTQKAYVNLDFRVDTVGTIIYLVHSRPLFYFAPDSSSGEPEGVTWQLWRVDDVENLNNPAYESSVMPASVQRSWGAVLSIYSGICD